jgi:Tol biopolymer transport system component
VRSTSAVIVAFLLAACQAAQSSTAPTPTAPPGSEAPSDQPQRSGLIAFQRTGEGIFTIGANGAGEAQLLPGEYQNPRWSPDGKLLALSHILDDEHGVVVPAVSKPDGSDASDLPLSKQGLNCGAPVWSSNGRLLALECWAEDSTMDGLYVARAADGGELRQVTSGHGIPGGFSPDGNQIVFTDPDGMLAIVGVDGSGGHRLGDQKVGIYPGFLPDGTSVFAAMDGAIVIFDLAGNVVRTVRAPEAKMSEPRLSPDGTQLVFVYDPQVVPAPGLARIGLDGTAFADVLRATTPGIENVAPDWSR